MNKGTKILLACAGLLLVALGIYCICRPTQTLFASAWLIGLMTLLSGISTLIFTFKTQRFLPNSGTRMLSGLLQVVLGVVFLSNKLVLTVSLPVIFAIWVIIEGVTLAIESFDFKKVGFGGWWCILILGIVAAVLGFLGLRNPADSGRVLSTLIGIGIAASGISYLVALAGINRFESRVKKLFE